MYNKKILIAIVLLLSSICVSFASERLWLSGRGYRDTVDWDFYCTKGRQSGYWTSIPVPSNWELQGFGEYNYGHDNPKSDEQGKYRKAFEAPSAWKNKRVYLVFEGVMTDAEVTVNGRSAGPKHQGGFYQFEYDITDAVQIGGDNLLEVAVSKVSSNESVEKAERQADFWVFGGIYRPVYLEARSLQNIGWTAIDAQADGHFRIDVHLRHIQDANTVAVELYDASGKLVNKPLRKSIAPGCATTSLRTSVASPETWTAETPRLYAARVRLLRGQDILDEATERFGFRTMEVRKGDGIYVNGRKIRIKGVNRHSFWPDSGRTLNRQICYDDARLIKSMNMNAVRMSHYPPDKHFLEACDELGLYVIDELTGWHDAYDTKVGKRLVAEMIRRDVNHPCILLWANGNEGGHNFELVPEYALYDPQGRVVIHPTPSWDSPSVFNGIDTAHYCSYDDLVHRLTQRKNIFLPTEFLHGLYDGGAGAGMNDYWEAITESPFGAGGFIWALTDEGVVRTDRNGQIDADGNHAPDGIVGPYREKGGSYYTLKEIWSPVQILLDALPPTFTGFIDVANHYDFTELNQCRFEWQWADFVEDKSGGTGRKTRQKGGVAGPAVSPGKTGRFRIDVPSDWHQRDALYVTAFGPAGEELFTWSWPVKAPSDYRKALVDEGHGPIRVHQDGDNLHLATGPFVFQFDLKTGHLQQVLRGGQPFSFGNGPRFIPAGAYARFLDIVSVAAEDAEEPNVAGNVADGNQYTRWSSRGSGANIVLDLGRSQSFSEVQIAWQRGHQRRFRFDIETSEDHEEWTAVFRGQSTGTTDQPEPYAVGNRTARYVRISGKGNTENEWTSILQVRIPAETADETLMVTHGSDDEGYFLRVRNNGNRELQWTLYPSGWLRLDYTMRLTGEFDYAGVTFDYPEEAVLSKAWIGDGPYRVWKNRMRGTRFDFHEQLYNDPKPGQSWAVPEFKGYFSNLYRLDLNTRQGTMTVMTDTPGLYARLFTPSFGKAPKHAVAAMPEGDISFLHAISAIGTKFQDAGRLGPESRKTVIQGEMSGVLYYRFD